MAGRRGWGSIVFRNGRAYAAITIDGKRTMRVLRDERGDAIPADLPLAEEAIERLRRKIRVEQDLDGGERARLGDWIDAEYSAILRSRLTPQSAHQAEQYLVRFAEWAEQSIGEGVFMEDVQRAHAERFVADFLAGRTAPPIWRADRPRAKSRAYGPAYVRRFVNVLSRAWSDARERGYVTKNPWSRLRLPRVPETTVPWVEPRDLERILDATTEFQRPYLRFLAWTGLRVGEAEQLRRDDVDLDRATLHVRHGKTRGSRRSVPLTPETVALLQGQPVREDGLLWEPRERHGSLHALSRACHHLKLPPLTLHQLRHVYASHLVVAGAPPTVVASLLGHVDGGALVLRLYGRWFPADAQQRAVASMAAFRATRGTAPSTSGTRAPPSGRSGPGRASAGSSRAAPSPRRR